jgi:hypothetical protein
MQCQVWTSLQGIDPSYAIHFDRVLEQKGSHAGKLNHLAMEISQEADSNDLLMFLDGDAFPIADPMPLITDGLAKAPLVAVCRAENAGDRQPHPCFCVTTIGTWRNLLGDWSDGATWLGPKGELVSDVGANLMRRLELAGTPWVQVLRSNRHNLHPLFFGVYGDVVYHHGAGFRKKGVSRIDMKAVPDISPLPPMPLPSQVIRLIEHIRWRRRQLWVHKMNRRYIRQSNLIFHQIQQGGSKWLAELI